MSCVTHPATEDVRPCGRCGRTYCDDCLVLLRDGWVCAECKHDVLLDVISGTVVERVPLARMSARTMAYLIDRLLLYLPMYGILAVVKWLIDDQLRLGVPHNVVGESMLFLFYLFFVVYEGKMLSARGQTLGKMAMRIRVVRPDGSPLTRRQAWGRAIARALFTSIWVLAFFRGLIFYMTPLFLLGNLDALVGLLTPRHTALHDLVARTRVFSAE